MRGEPFDRVPSGVPARTRNACEKASGAGRLITTITPAPFVRLQAVSAEPAEQLLRAVRHQQQAAAGVLQEDLPIPLAHAFSLRRVFAADAGAPETKQRDANGSAPR